MNAPQTSTRLQPLLGRELTDSELSHFYGGVTGGCTWPPDLPGNPFRELENIGVQQK
jgi:hypothetical protein